MTPTHSKIQIRRERVFLVLAGLFLSAMTLLNVVGITKFIQFGPLAVAVGVLPYPLTFLCTDLISELYGRSRANFLVWVGLFINLFVLAVLYFGNLMPAVGASEQPPWQVLSLSSPVSLPNGETLQGQVELFHLVYACTRGAVLASMFAYMTAQFCDVYLFHKLRDWTQGRHLWLRNNGSTLVSQLVDSVAVISVTFGALFFQGKISLQQVLILMGSNYLFKFIAALIDTLPFYLAVSFLRPYLGLSQDPSGQVD